MTQELAQVETPIGAFRAVVGDGIVRTAGFVKTNGVRRDSSGVLGRCLGSPPRAQNPRGTNMVHSTEQGRDRQNAELDLTVDETALAWSLPSAGSTIFDFDYTNGRDELLRLYDKGTRRQWVASD